MVVVNREFLDVSSNGYPIVFNNFWTNEKSPFYTLQNTVSVSKEAKKLANFIQLMTICKSSCFRSDIFNLSAVLFFQL